MSNSSGKSIAGKSPAHLQAELMAEKMFADMMASAGVSHSRMGVELMYFIPRQFRDAYIRLFRKALKGDDADAGANGIRNAEVGALGRAAGKNDDSGVTSLGENGERGERGERGREKRRTIFASGQTRSVSSGRGKKYKRYWTVEDERALDLKEAIDKRLRRMAMEINSLIDEWEKEVES